MGDLGHQGRSWPLSGRATLAWTALWAAVAALVVLPYMHSYRHLSPLDEMVHLDYVVQVQHGHLVRGGERVGRVSMREQACRGHDSPDFEGPPCSQKVLHPRDFSFDGYNTAYPDPPAYYLVTAAGAAALEALPGVTDVVTAARAVGVLWLGAGLMLTFVLGLTLGAGRLASAGATLVVASSPAVTHAAATITSDAPSLLTGAALCLVAAAVVRGRIAWWWLVPAAAATTAVKATGLVVAGAVVVFLLLHLVSPRARHSDGESTDPAPLARRTLLLAASAVAASASLVLLGWMCVNVLTNLPAADDIPQNDYFYVDSLSWDQVIANLLALTSPLQNGYQPPFMSDVSVTVLMNLVNIVLLSGVAAVAWNGRPGAVRTRMAVACLAAMLVSGVGLVLLIYVGSHIYITIPARYGLCLVPALAAALAVAASRHRVGGYAVTGLGVVAMTALLVQTL